MKVLGRFQERKISGTKVLVIQKFMEINWLISIWKFSSI